MAPSSSTALPLHATQLLPSEPSSIQPSTSLPSCLNLELASVLVWLHRSQAAEVLQTEQVRTWAHQNPSATRTHLGIRGRRAACHLLLLVNRSRCVKSLGNCATRLRAQPRGLPCLVAPPTAESRLLSCHQSPAALVPRGV